MKSFAPKPWVVPQPVLIIGTYNKEGVANAMNAAWAGQWDMKEIIISMGNHVTTDNLKLGGEFTVAFATKKTMVASDFVGIVSAKNDPKKMEKTGWNIKKANMVNAPVFTDFPMTLECRIKEKYDESETGYYLVAEIVNILVDEKYLAEDGNPDMEKMELIVFDPIHHSYIQLGEKASCRVRDKVSRVIRYNESRSESVHVFLGPVEERAVIEIPCRDIAEHEVCPGVQVGCEFV